MNSKPAIFGAIILGILVLGLVIWYAAEHPAPYVNHPTATTTPGNTGTINTGSSLVLTEHAAYYDVDASYPPATPLKSSAGAAADAKAVVILKGFEQNAIDAFKEEGNFANLSATDIKMLGLDQGRKESLAITYKEKSGPHTVSYVLTLVQDTLGAHPNSYYRTFTFDSKTGTGLELGDLFVPNTDYASAISTIARQKLPSVIAASSGIGASQVDAKMISDGTSPDADNFQNWYLEGGNLVILFPPYQVAPYAAGPQTLVIPLSELGTKLKAQYR